MASKVLLVAMPILVVTRELVSSLSVSLPSLVHMYLHYSKDSYYTLEDSPRCIYEHLPVGCNKNAIPITAAFKVIFVLPTF